MKVLTFSRHFPKGHPRSGQPTFFVERILNSIHNGRLGLDNICRELKEFINDFELIANQSQKHHTVRVGSRFKPGDMISLRIWSNKPYRSKQIEFAQVKVKKTWEVQIYIGEVIIEAWVNGNKILSTKEVRRLAANDGLEEIDFVNWFKIHPKTTKSICFNGQIICWSNEINY